MKCWLLLFIVSLCVVLTGGEAPVRIADTLGDPAVRTAAVRLALAGKPVACTQELVTLEKAFAGLQKGEYDLVLAYRSAVPANLQAQCRDYAVDAAMIAVNVKNPKSNFTVRELAEAFSGWRRSWLTYNGTNFQIHLMRLPDDAPAVRIFRDKVLGKRTFSAAFERKNSMELLHLAVLNENALVLTTRPDAELATNVKAVSVEGVYPSLENIKSGRYPLCERRVVVISGKAAGKVQELLSMLFSADMGSVIAEHGGIQP